MINLHLTALPSFVVKSDQVNLEYKWKELENGVTNQQTTIT